MIFFLHANSSLVPLLRLLPASPEIVFALNLSWSGADRADCGRRRRRRRRSAVVIRAGGSQQVASNSWNRSNAGAGREQLTGRAARHLAKCWHRYTSSFLPQRNNRKLIMDGMCGRLCMYALRCIIKKSQFWLHIRSPHRLHLSTLPEGSTVLGPFLPSFPLYLRITYVPRSLARLHLCAGRPSDRRAEPPPRLRPGPLATLRRRSDGLRTPTGNLRKSRAIFDAKMTSSRAPFNTCDR